MPELIPRPAFSDWFDSLRDRQAKRRISARLDRLAFGNPGDIRPVGEGVSELRLDFGPGYRIYVFSPGRAVVVLLGGGDKDTQQRDIVAALAEATAIREEDAQA